MERRFVRNIWYMAAWPEEVGRALLSRTLLGEDILFFRKQDGAVCAIQDLCPHRYVPLSMGKLVGDTVECHYHGLAFDCSGSCVSNPHGKGIIPKAARTARYVTAERHGAIWIWMGKPNEANEETIPDFSFMASQQYASVHGYINIKANYLLMMDNLTDLSHAGFVHQGSLEPREIAQADYAVTQEGNRLWTRQFLNAMPVPALWKALTGEDGHMDHWLEMRFDPPGCMITYYGLTDRGRSRVEGKETLNPNLITPETATTTHYFWATCRNWRVDDAQLSGALRAGVGSAFENEDRPIIEAQQRKLGTRDLMDMRPVLLPNDAGSARARQTIKSLLDKESALAHPDNVASRAD